MSRTFYLEEPKPPTSEWFGEIDIASWLDTETIDSVTFVATDRADDSVVTATVTDTGSNTWSGSILKPWIQAGTDGHSYKLIMTVTTTDGSVEQFALYWDVKTL